MDNKVKKLIIRISKEDDKIISDLRNNFNVNISSLVRNLIIEYYKRLKNDEK
jgi:hypothetical protein